MPGAPPARGPLAGLSDADFTAAAVADLRETLDQLGGSVAALIAEPIQGVGGFTHGPDGVLGALAAVLREHGILWISDEVQTGWGRTGEHFWGWQAHGFTPDIVTFAKGVGNGLSMGGVIARAEIMDSLVVDLEYLGRDSYMPLFVVLREGAALVFFAYIGFDIVATTAEESRTPKRSMIRPPSSSDGISINAFSAISVPNAAVDPVTAVSL